MKLKIIVGVILVKLTEGFQRTRRYQTLKLSRIFNFILCCYKCLCQYKHWKVSVKSERWKERGKRGKA